MVLIEYNDSCLMCLNCFCIVQLLVSIFEVFEFLCIVLVLYHLSNVDIW